MRLIDKSWRPASKKVRVQSLPNWQEYIIFIYFSMFRLTYSASASSSSSYLIIVKRIFFIIIFLGSNLFQFVTTKGAYGNCGYINKNATNRVLSCRNGNVITLQYPFWSMVEKEDRYYCGYPGFGITCNPIDGKPVLNISNQLYYVIGIDQLSKQLTIVETDFFEQDCPTPSTNFESHSLFRLEGKDYNTQLTFFLGCSTPPPQTRNVTTLNMIGSNSINCQSNSQKSNSYGFLDFNLNKSEQKSLAGWSQNSCNMSVIVPVQNSDYTHGYENLILYTYILRSGFKIRWVTPIECQKCEKSGGFCSYNETYRTYICWCGAGQLIRNGADRKEYYCSWHSDTLFDGALPADTSMHNKILIIGICSGFGGLALLMILLLFIYRNNQKKRIGSIAKNVELFLESYGYRSLQRYKYKDIKKMTNSFKDKLGQGGYGSVYKGKLVDGRLVAVKVLINDPKKSTNGEDFMNEVATIGRTNHVNVVALLGFCSSGSKRALVYEFMTNGSLEKFIYAKKEKDAITSTSSIEVDSTSSTEMHALGLGWEKLYQIAIGIARGLEYLHRGCNTGRILHFDIKPHNILLDDNFCPKISDFGLAKLCPTRESIVSILSGGRGTIGYIAPEVYNRNFGRVSYKSDVYSYGMMVLEMVGGRKNIDPFVENTSEIYFPHWIYNHFEKDQDRIQDLFKFEEAFDEETAKKMIMVGLWCIQTHQESRPSMGKVAEMLEGSIKDLQMPPNPFVDPSLHPQG